ncbi:hypothetical protein [Rhizobium ruizarguesonis]|uniref:hypothetical protein n=1 Tax=Rhizobium ruizarguesonis TaxID=2081791 RepID=UPI00102F5C7E|nr:hypothetical protein [Rhizobium ruizarguesonis]TBE02295.1 hypothetical protein ELH10_15475 [Rhizobium ruizarguesonis]TBF14671.1 hypothetical protein ELG95_14620 [Rhizobium ruizarguesonis]
MSASFSKSVTTRALPTNRVANSVTLDLSLLSILPLQEAVDLAADLGDCCIQFQDFAQEEVLIDGHTVVLVTGDGADIMGTDGGSRFEDMGMKI